MRRREPRLDPELVSLLAPGKVERRAPPDVRARALAGARAIIAANGRLPTARVLQFPSHLLARRRAPVWFPLAVGVVLAVAVASAAAVALRLSKPSPSSEASPAPAPSSIAVRDEPREAASVDVPKPMPLAPATASTARAARTANNGSSDFAEFDLLSRAQTAYTHSEFSRALALIAEHARRFPHGHLAEEREALRVRSLARFGQAAESERAEAAFKQRFPRSVLVPPRSTSIAQ